MQLKVRASSPRPLQPNSGLLDYWLAIRAGSSPRPFIGCCVGGAACHPALRSMCMCAAFVRKFEVDAENPRYLKTVRGAGYRFELPKASNRAGAGWLYPGMPGGCPGGLSGWEHRL